MHTVQHAKVDFEYLKGLEELNVEGERDLAEQLIEYFLGSAVHKIEQILDAPTPDQARQVAHSLKSSCNNVGAFGLAELCGRFESAKAEEISGLTTQLTRALPAVVERLNEFLLMRKS